MKHHPLELDFRRAPGGAGRWLGWALLALAALAAAATVEHHTRVAEQHEAAVARQDRLEASLRKRLPRNTPADIDPATVAELKRANQVIQQLAVPWDSLFDAVEAAGTQGTHLLALTPTARDRSLRLSGEAASVDAALTYVERLAAQPALSQVHLLGYSSVERDGANVVSFSVTATWRVTP